MLDADKTDKPARPVRVMPPVYLLAAIVTMVALHFLLPGVIVLPGPWRWLGLVPLIGGVLFSGSAVRLFSRYKTTIKPGQVSSHLMMDGPFRLSRNPIYLGMTIGLAGIAVLLGSLTPWLVLPVFVWVIAHNVIPVEEAVMGETFGQQYQQYQARVRRWI